MTSDSKMAIAILGGFILLLLCAAAFDTKPAEWASFTATFTFEHHILILVGAWVLGLIALAITVYVVVRVARHA